MRELEEDRVHWLKCVEDGRACAERDDQVVELTDTYVKLKVPGFDGQTKHEAYLDLFDYGRMSVIESMTLGAFYVRQFSGYPVLAANKKQKNGEFNNSSSYVHTLITDKLGFRHFRNGNTLDCRRANLVTDDSIRTEVPPEPVPEDSSQSELVQQQLNEIRSTINVTPEA